MFLSYLIDPDDRTVRKVYDGFDNAASLIGTDDIEVNGLWESLFDPDSSVIFIFAPDASDETDRLFRLHLTYEGREIEKVAFGKAVLVACGSVPAEIAAQVSSVQTLTTAIDFGDTTSTEMVDWLKRHAVNSQRAPARRAGAKSRAHTGRGTGSNR
jgi:hypothetical protein